MIDSNDVSFHNVFHIHDVLYLFMSRILEKSSIITFNSHFLVIQYLLKDIIVFHRMYLTHLYGKSLIATHVIWHLNGS